MKKLRLLKTGSKEKRHVIKNTDKTNIDGDYSIELNNNSYNLKITSLSNPHQLLQKTP